MHTVSSAHHGVDPGLKSTSGLSRTLGSPSAVGVWTPLEETDPPPQFSPGPTAPYCPSLRHCVCLRYGPHLDNTKLGLHDKDKYSREPTFGSSGIFFNCLKWGSKEFYFSNKPMLFIFTNKHYLLSRVTLKQPPFHENRTPATGKMGSTQSRGSRWSAAGYWKRHPLRGC